MPAPTRLRRALRSSPVRQALVLLAVFALVNLLTLGGTWLKLRDDLAAQIRADLALEMQSFDLSATPRALAAIVAAKARAVDATRTVIVFLGADGSRVGNAVARFEGGELHLFAEGAGALAEAGYLHEARRLSGGVLIVAMSLAPLGALDDAFLTLLALSLAPTIVLSLGVAAWLSRRAARRVRGVEEVLDRLTEGDLSARYAEAGAAEDDIARIAAGVNRLAARQEAATDALRQVTADIAHDLRTPLQRLSALLHDLRARLPESEAAGLAARAAGEADRAVSVFRALLEIAQIEGGDGAARLSVFDLRAPARRIVELYEPAAEEGGRRLSYSEPEAEVRVEADADLLAQALANLVENALRHTPEGSRVAVAVGEGPEGPELSVSDDGPGIPEGEREKVTRRLYRLERSRTTEGHGLGLALVAAIAQRCRARLVLEDAGPGLRARVIFPRPKAG